MGVCLWPGNNELMKRYHDNEWCVPSHDDAYIFEMLTLEGAQAGLSWNTVLGKREDYQRAFHHFEIAYCSTLTDEALEIIAERYNVIKNRSKLRSVRNNALAVLNIQKEFGSLANFLWNYVGGNPVINSWESEGQVPAQTPLSEQISKDLKKRGFKFVGPVIVYSFMQAIGLVDDHIRTCPCHSLNR
ncbi:DNA-3-methyladenine glycosylase I [Desulfosporosinus sp. SB140]|uniref:DNA-3-methyladenine glycosylase I n=1 Tax=Desulfosporosinus paludis TaxID=3115649 RepID=UPI00388FE4B6